MIQLSLLPATPHAPLAPALLASQGASSFAVALGALASPARVAVADKANALTGYSGGEILLPGRQMPAEGGKDLPAPGADGGKEAGDKANDGASIAFAWFAVAPLPVAAPAAPVALDKASAARIVSPGTSTPPEAPPRESGTSREPAPAAPLQRTGNIVSIAAPLDTEAMSAVPIVSAEAVPAKPDAKPPLLQPSGSLGRTGGPGCPADVTQDRAGSATAFPDRQIGAEPGPTVLAPASVRPTHFPEAGKSIVETVEAPARLAASIAEPTRGRSAEAPAAPGQRLSDQTRAAPVPAVVPVVAFPAGPSGPPLAPPIVEAVAIAPAPLRRATDREPLATAVQLPAGEAVQPNAVSAPADVQQGALDTRRQEWVGKMVEHIETLRDAAPLRETRLSLAPEALGKVEIAIRHDGDRVHVHFATETLAARQLIADAQPRLAELAEARGLKLGQTSFESGTAGQGSNRDGRDNPVPQPSLRPRPANPRSAGRDADDRIA